jgi:hypothetical protein
MSEWTTLGTVSTSNGALAIVPPYFGTGLSEFWQQRLRDENPVPVAFEEIELHQRTIRHDLLDYDDAESGLLFHTPGNGAWDVEGRFEEVSGEGRPRLVELRIRLFDDD